MPKRISNGFDTPLPPEVTMNEPTKLDSQARARRKTAVLWFVAVTFGTMALLSLPIGRFITNGLGKGGLLHHALGPVERLIRPISGWEPPVRSELPPSAQAELSGPVLQPELFRSIEFHIPSAGHVPAKQPVPSIVVAAPSPVHGHADDKQSSMDRVHHRRQVDGRHPRHRRRH
jgi:hypothetical protein